MKNTFIITTLILASFTLFNCNKVENKPPTVISEHSIKDSATTEPKLPNTDQDSTAEKIAHYIATEYIKPEDLEAMEISDRKFRYKEIDLNGDGNKEVFVIFSTPYFCGTGGCSMILLDDQLKPITKFTVIRPPVFADPETKNGWKILYIKDREEWRELIFENGKYPSNPSVLPATTKKPSDNAIGIFENGESKDIEF